MSFRLGADPSIPEKDGYTSSHGVAFQGREQAARVLVKHGVDVDEKQPMDTIRYTELCGAVSLTFGSKGSGEGGRCKCRCTRWWGIPPSHKALASSWHRCRAPSSSARVNLQAGNGETLLHLAVQNRDERAVTAIVKAGGNPAVKNGGSGMSPLDMAHKSQKGS